MGNELGGGVALLLMAEAVTGFGKKRGGEDEMKISFQVARLLRDSIVISPAEKNFHSIWAG